jgi:Flp pilus assembly protein TadG
VIRQMSQRTPRFTRRYPMPATVSACPRATRPLNDKGSATVELVILAPVFVLMLAFVFLVGRVQSSRADIEAAAHSATRSITLSREPQATAAAAKETTTERLQAGTPSCRSMGWDATITSGSATVTISCDVDLSEAALLPVPGTFTVEATSSELFDRFTEPRQ